MPLKIQYDRGEIERILSYHPASKVMIDFAYHEPGSECARALFVLDDEDERVSMSAKMLLGIHIFDRIVQAGGFLFSVLGCKEKIPVLHDMHLACHHRPILAPDTLECFVRRIRSFDGGMYLLLPYLVRWIRV